MCVNGTCRCLPSYTGKACNARSCPNDCNGRGPCVGFKCRCQSPWTGVDCNEMSCNSQCDAHGICFNGTCFCEEGYSGKWCTQKMCPSQCSNRGDCVTGKCVCKNGFRGDWCQFKICPSMNRDVLCSGHGECMENQICACYAGYSGLGCGKATQCKDDCNQQGLCNEGKCFCDPGFVGMTCSQSPCLNQCSGKGECTLISNAKSVDNSTLLVPFCACKGGHVGQDCSQPICPNNCSGKGACMSGKCDCQPDKWGDDCSKSCPSINQKVTCSGHGACRNGAIAPGRAPGAKVCMCDPGFGGYDCNLKICPYSCSGHGNCLDGMCLCHSGFLGLSCGIELSTSGAGAACKCVQRCTTSCLTQCTSVYEKSGAQASHRCFRTCSNTCAQNCAPIANVVEKDALV